jgi:hypothetical protein
VGQTPAVGQAAFTAEFEPRLAARFALSERAALLAAFGLYSQPPRARDLSAVFGTPTLGVEHATHLSVGEAVELSSTLSTSVTFFHRSLTQLSERASAATPALAQALTESGTGHSYGVQILARQRAWRGFFGWVAYTLSRSERQNAPGMRSRLFDVDQPHVLTLVGSQELANWTLGVRYRYASGSPRTPVIGALYDAKDDVFQPIFGAQNSLRLPAFSELDLRVDRRFHLGDALLGVYLEALNVSDRANAEEYVYKFDYTRRGVITGLPLTGVAGLRLER